MGRHSTPDAGDDDAVEIDSPLAVFDVAELRGRHAVADDEPVDAPSVGAESDNGFDQALTQRIGVIDAAPPQAAPQPPRDVGPAPDKKNAKAAQKAERKAAQKAERKAARKAQRGESGTRADLRVLREQPAVRAQVIGVVIAAFLIYTLVLLVLGRTDKYVLWLWVPIVACGVLVGLVLDLAHRRAHKENSASG